MDELTLAELKTKFPHISEDVLEANIAEEIVNRAPAKAIPRIKLRTKLVDPRPVFKSKTEERAWTYVDRFNPAAKYYELLMFRLPGGNYTPDFNLVMQNGELWLIEVKGKGEFRAYQSGRSSKKALKESAHQLSWVGRWFVLIDKPQKDGAGWYFEELNPHIESSGKGHREQP